MKPDNSCGSHSCEVPRMIRGVAAVLLLTIGADVLSAAAAADSISPDEYGLTVNYDINTVTTPFLRKFENSGTVAMEELWPVVDVYAGTQVKSLLFNVFCQFSAIDSEVFTTYAEKYEQKEENGVEVDYTSLYGGLYNIQKRLGMDVFRIWIDRCREKGISPGISIRMNDCHLPREKASFLRSSFFYEAQANGWMLGKSIFDSYYQTCLDYSVPQVREKMLAYIAETLKNYDIDTFELDFLREIYCFPLVYNQSFEERCAIMNSFIRSVSVLVDEAEIRLGHPIELSVRLMRDIRQCRFLGFDVEAWHNEGLVDAIVVSPHWFTCDSDIPIRSWIEAFPKFRIQAGLEVMVMGKEITVPMAAAQAVQYLSQGSKGIYLFNYFDNPDAPLDRNQQIFRSCGSLETSIKEERRHVVTRQDVVVPLDNMSYNPLNRPFGTPFSISVSTGPIPEGSEVTLFFGINGGNCPEVSVNGKKIKASKIVESPETVDYVKGPSKFYSIDISRLNLNQDAQNLIFTPTASSATLTALEIRIL